MEDVSGDARSPERDAGGVVTAFRRGAPRSTFGQGGTRPDLGGVYFRSRMEANYARYLNLLVRAGKIASWEYEPHEFVFEKITRGTRTYKPDFKVVKLDGSHEWHEVKGWMDPKSKTKLDRMARYFPAERVIVIGKEWARSAKRTVAHLIPGWESGAKRKP